MAVAFATLSGAVRAEEPAATGSISGRVGTGLPVPRFVSLKPSDTPMREGPSKEHPVKWVFKRDGMPVEITAEFENWRRIRDYEGVEGWVYHTRLSGRRTVMVQIRPRQKLEPVPLFASNDDRSAVLAKLEPGVVANPDTCDGKWCRIHGEGFDGYMRQDKLWGVYSTDTGGKLK